MIHHGYTGCATCHADPSGGSLLTAYGRAQSEILLRSHYGSGPATEEEPGKLGDFAFGVIPLPESVLLGGDYRGAWLDTQVQGSPVRSQYLQMQGRSRGTGERRPLPGQRQRRVRPHRRAGGADHDARRGQPHLPGLVGGRGSR